MTKAPPQVLLLVQRGRLSGEHIENVKIFVYIMI